MDISSSRQYSLLGSREHNPFIMGYYTRKSLPIGKLVRVRFSGSIFGAEQVFDTSAYSCLLFLSKDEKTTFSYTKPEAEPISAARIVTNVRYDKNE